MIVGCYTLHLYCDGERCVLRRSRGEIIGPSEYTGNTGGEARNAARRDGWKIDEPNDKAWCRKCRSGAT